MKTILYVESGSGFGGAATCLSSLLRYLDRSAYRPLVGYYRRGLGIERIEKLGVPAIPLHWGWAWLELARLIRRERVDLVHINNELYSHLPGILAARWARRPCVVHMRGIRPLTRRERWLIRYVDHFVIISEHGRRHYIREGIPDARISMIYDGLDLPAFDDQQNRRPMRDRFGFGEDEIVVGMVSRLVPKKGHQDFLQAMSLVARELPHVRGVVVGGDPAPDQHYFMALRQLAKELGLASRVSFTGWRDDISAVTASFDIAVQASHYQEGFGTAIMEAMALGKPVVSTEVGGVPELVGHGEAGLLVPKGDVAALARALRELAVNEQTRHRYGEAGRRRVEQLFDQRRQVLQLEALYRTLLGQERG